ncbi:SERTA domain-containing protein 3 [Marasmius crinis-equi]|uniref:SERTA domain-containing protein 3 n=1 Tax=Marasmius crinis-equi TaxID=585013 RepID=A0ABR3ENL8_9AGAR
MPARPMFTGQHAEFLSKKGAEYAKARDNGTHKDIVAIIQREFLLRWPIGSEKVDLMEEQLRAIDGNATLPERANPEGRREDFKSEEEYEQAVNEWKQYNKELATRKRMITSHADQLFEQQIEDRLKTNYNKEHAPAMKKGDKHPFTPLLMQLTVGKSEAKKGKPRKLSAEQTWAEANKEDFDAIQKARRAKEKIKNSDGPAFYNQCLRDEFAKLSAAEKEEWEERSKSVAETRAKEWKEKQQGKPSESPEDRQACIARLNEFCMPILEGIAERTGWSCSLLLGGPEPRDGGRINMLALHAGKPTSGPVKMQFGRAEVNAWRNQFFPVFGGFLKKVYSMEECRSRALPTGYKSDKQVEADGEEVLRWRDPEGDATKEADEESEGSKKGGEKSGEGQPEKDRSSQKGERRKAKAGSEKGKTNSRDEDTSSKKKTAKTKRTARAVSESSDTADEDLSDDENTIPRSSPPLTRRASRHSEPSVASPTVSAAWDEAVPRASTPSVSPKRSSAAQDAIPSRSHFVPLSPPIRSPPVRSPSSFAVPSLPPSLIRSGPRNGSRGPQERRHTCSPSPVGADGRAAMPTPLPERSLSPLDAPSPSEASRGPSAK